MTWIPVGPPYSTYLPTSVHSWTAFRQEATGARRWLRPARMDASFRWRWSLGDIGKGTSWANVIKSFDFLMPFWASLRVTPPVFVMTTHLLKALGASWTQNHYTDCKWNVGMGCAIWMVLFQISPLACYLSLRLYAAFFTYTIVCGHMQLRRCSRLIPVLSSGVECSPRNLHCTWNSRQSK